MAKTNLCNYAAIFKMPIKCITDVRHAILKLCSYVHFIYLYMSLTHFYQFAEDVKPYYFIESKLQLIARKWNIATARRRP